MGNGRCRQAAAAFQLCTSLPTHHATLLEDEPLNLSLLRHCSLPQDSTYFPFTTTTNFPFELLNSTYLLTKYLYVYLFSCRTIKIELFPSKYLLRSVRIRTVFRARYNTYVPLLPRKSTEKDDKHSNLKDSISNKECKMCKCHFVHLYLNCIVPVHCFE